MPVDEFYFVKAVLLEDLIFTSLDWLSPLFILSFMILFVLSSFGGESVSIFLGFITFIAPLVYPTAPIFRGGFDN